MVWFYVANCHFQQYFSYIVGVSFIGDRKPEFPGENHRPAAASHWETLSHNDSFQYVAWYIIVYLIVC
jgi:hypothetical protein